MKVKSIGFNSRTGYSLEWYQPGVLVLEPIDIMVLMSYLCAEPDIDEFSDYERAIIANFLDRREALYCKNLDEVQGSTSSFEQSKKQLKHWLHLMTHWPCDDGNSYYQKLKASLPESRPHDHLFLAELQKEWVQEETMKEFIRRYGEPSLYIMEEIQRRFKD